MQLLAGRRPAGGADAVCRPDLHAVHVLHDLPHSGQQLPVVTTGVVVGTVPPAGEAQNVPLVVAAKSEV